MGLAAALPCPKDTYKMTTHRKTVVVVVLLCVCAWACVCAQVVVCVCVGARAGVLASVCLEGSGAWGGMGGISTYWVHLFYGPPRSVSRCLHRRQRPAIPNWMMHG